MAQTGNFVGTVEDMKKMTNDADKDREIWGYSWAAACCGHMCGMWWAQGGAAETNKLHQLNCLGN